jgi:hypothetical protein
MGNMSYCRFQNTASDLNDCVESLEMDGIESLSPNEQQSAVQMARLCEEYLDAYKAASGEDYE